MGPWGHGAAPPVFSEDAPRAEPPTEPYDAVMIVGQSNAVGQGELDDREPSDPAVWMLGNDYLFKVAYEPLDDSSGQVDLVSRDHSVVPDGPRGHTWALRAAKEVAHQARRRLLLIPCQKGGTRLDQWMPQEDRWDRDTLYGSANYRQALAAPAGLKMIWWYGHESSSEPPYQATYAEDWIRLLGEFRVENPNVPVLYAQLAGIVEEAPGAYPGLSELLLIAAETQRRMESRSRDSLSQYRHHMVVTFDLPTIDYIHLNRMAVDTLANRLALAVRQHVYRQRVNGTGPRLLYLRHPRHDKGLIKIRFNRPINQAFNDYDRQFRVYDDGVEVPLQRVERHADRRSVLITLQDPAQGSVTVSYGGRSLPDRGIGFPNVIKDSDGLPAPQFWRLPVQ